MSEVQEMYLTHNFKLITAILVDATNLALFLITSTSIYSRLILIRSYSLPGFINLSDPGSVYIPPILTKQP